MRPPTSTQQRAQRTLIPTLFLSLAALIHTALANPFPKDDLHNTLGHGFLQDPSCATYCGADNEHCCADGELCTTADSTARCATATAAALPAHATANPQGASWLVYTTTWVETEVILPTLAPRAPDDGSWSVYTTTWTETDTFTSTVSSYWAVSSESSSGGTCSPPAGSGEIACGSICCASWQYCAYDGQCLSNPGATATDSAGASSETTYPTTMTISGTTITTQFSAPYRVTGTGSTSTNTATAESATTTGSGNGTAVATTGGSNLSGGAIAGIVVGTLAGVALLMLLCFCCVMRGLWHGLLALLGFGPKKRRDRSRDRETIIIEEERRTRRGSSHTGRGQHSSWFAAGPARSTTAESRRTSEKRHESNQASWWGAGALGTLLLLLGLRRDKKRRQSTSAKRSSRPSARSDVSSSYFPDSYTASSPSELSSDYTYSSVYTPAPAPARSSPRAAHYSRAGDPPPPRAASVVRSHSVRSASRYRDHDRDYEREYDLPPKSNLPPDYAGSASSGDRTRDTRRSRRTETTRISRAQSRR